MCRFLVYKGSDEILLSKLILDPSHSILKQSFDSRLRLDTRRGQNNADGFGIGFYTDPKLGAAPCLFTSTIPAWNCTNLQRIASKTASRLVFAHVRATTEGSLSEDNCHPFTHGSLMWMHNGGLGGWKHIKRRLGARLADKWYLGVTGGTDSEWAFALFLDTLERSGYDPSNPPASGGGFGPTVLRKAMARTIEIINELTESIPESTVHSENVDARSLLNFAVTDGHSVICTRYINSATDQAASLYYSSGSTWEERPSADVQGRNYRMERRDKGADVVLVASEPLTFERENWVNVPTNSILTIHGQTVMVHPILDGYSNRSPYQKRSAAFVQAKGLVANEKGPAAAGTLTLNPRTASNSPEPAATPDVAAHRKPTIPFSMLRSRPSETHSPRPRTNLSTATTNVDSSISPTSAPSADIRSLTCPPISRQLPPNPPAQGNIKKKRMSLSGLEVHQGGGNTHGGTQHHNNANHGGQDNVHEPSDSPAEPPRNNFGDPNKIAQFFPELSMMSP